MPETVRGAEDLREAMRVPGGSRDLAEMVREYYAAGSANRVRLRDLNRRTSAPAFYKYTKDQIARYLKNPYYNEAALRDASIYLYNANSHYRRIISYFAGLSDLSYIISPYQMDTTSASPKRVRANFVKASNFVQRLDVKNTMADVLKICLIEDVCYLTLWMGEESIIPQRLPSKYCKIAYIQDNVLNVSFDFTYFVDHLGELEQFPQEFRDKYESYKADRAHMRWQELDAPTSFAIKCNREVLGYAIPPFAGIFRDIYDVEDYKDLKLTKTAIENYAMMVMMVPLGDDGSYLFDWDRAKKIWRNLDNILPEEIGSMVSPLKLEKFSFERSGVGDTDYIAEAENHLWSDAGVSSLLFNNEKASSNALLLSIKADQMITYGIVKSIESALNRLLHAQSFGRNFRINFLDVSPYNRKEAGDAYLKACQYGVPMVSYYCASQGISQSEMEALHYLEDVVMEVKDKFVPLQSSAQQSGEAGAPQKDVGDLSDSGEAAAEGSGDE